MRKRIRQMNPSRGAAGDSGSRGRGRSCRRRGWVPAWRIARWRVWSSRWPTSWGRLHRWIAGRLPGEEGTALVEKAGRSPAAQALLRRRLVLALGEDPAGVEELRVLLSPHAPVLAPGDFLLPESSGIPRQLPPAVAGFTGRGQELARLATVPARTVGSFAWTCCFQGCARPDRRTGAALRKITRGYPPWPRRAGRSARRRTQPRRARRWPGSCWRGTGRYRPGRERTRCRRRS